MIFIVIEPLYILHTLETLMWIFITLQITCILTCLTYCAAFLLHRLFQHLLMLHSNLCTDWTRYHKFRNKVTKEVCLAKLSYYESVDTSNSKNFRKAHTDEERADFLNHFFSTCWNAVCPPLSIMMWSVIHQQTSQAFYSVKRNY